MHSSYPFRREMLLTCRHYTPLTIPDVPFIREQGLRCEPVSAALRELKGSSMSVRTVGDARACFSRPMTDRRDKAPLPDEGRSTNHPSKHGSFHKKIETIYVQGYEHGILGERGGSRSRQPPFLFLSPIPNNQEMSRQRNRLILPWSGSQGSRKSKESPEESDYPLQQQKPGRLVAVTRNARGSYKGPSVWETLGGLGWGCAHGCVYLYL